MPKRNRNKPIVDLENDKVRAYLIEQGWKPPVKGGIRFKNPFAAGMADPVNYVDPGHTGTTIHERMREHMREWGQHQAREREDVLIADVMHGRPLGSIPEADITPRIRDAYIERMRREREQADRHYVEADMPQAVQETLDRLNRET